MVPRLRAWLPANCTALVLPPGQRPLALKRFIQAFGGVTGHALFSLKAVGPGVKWPVSLVADVHHVLSKQRFVALHLTVDASSRRNPRQHF